MSSRHDQISAGVTRYLRRYLQISVHRYLQISADICRYYEGKCVQYTITLSSRGATTTTMSPPPHADCALPKDRLCLLCSSRSSQLCRCLPPPPSRHHPAPSSSRLPSPRGASPSFLGGAGACRRCRRHSHSCSPCRQGDAGDAVIRMGEDDRPSPTTTRHVLPLWQRCRDAVRRGQRRERRRGGAATGSVVVAVIVTHHHRPRPPCQDEVHCRRGSVRHDHTQRTPPLVVILVIAVIAIIAVAHGGACTGGRR